MPCPLCNLRPRTKFLYEDAVCRVIICQSCRVPMVVIRRHTRNVTVQEANAMVAALTKVAKKFYKGKPWRIDRRTRSIPQHAHFHSRPQGD